MLGEIGFICGGAYAWGEAYRRRNTVYYCHEVSNNHPCSITETIELYCGPTFTCLVYFLASPIKFG